MNVFIYIGLFTLLIVVGGMIKSTVNFAREKKYIYSLLMIILTEGVIMVAIRAITTL